MSVEKIGMMKRSQKHELYDPSRSEGEDVPPSKLPYYFPLL